jgi:hypothetical protein
MPDSRKVLVIMPFSQTTEDHTVQYWSRHFTAYLKPLIEKNENVQVTRQEPLTGNDASQLVLDLIQANVVVADLTDQDANVVWALAVRQSFKYGTLIIAESGSRIPAYFARKEVLFYNGDYLDNQAFEQNFQTNLASALDSTQPQADSPVLETLGGRGTLYGVMHNEENARKVQGLQMELSINETLLAQIFDNCIRNKALRLANRADAKKMTTTPLKTAAVEFLLTTRYLDLDKTFYSTVYAYHNYLEAINSHLVEWESTSSDKEAEDWLLACKEPTYKNIGKLKEQLQQTRQA